MSPQLIWVCMDSTTYTTSTYNFNDLTTSTTTTTTIATTTPHYNSKNIHHLIATSHNHHINSTYAFIKQFINVYIRITIHQSRLFMINKVIWKLTVLPKTFMYTAKANPKQKRVKRTQEHEKTQCYWAIRLAGRLTRSGELSYASWRANTTLWHTIVRRGKRMASKHCSLSRCSLPWRADYSSWRVMTDFCREERFFTPKTQFSSTPIQIW